jgi:DNA repair exonuclease SbcCD ATPase subunit
MQLIINGFRCYLHKEIELPDCGLTLLSGPSGIGKTTIFDAISWVIHGQMQDLYNKTHPNTPLNVQLTLSGMVIYRQKRPDRLILQCNGQQYEDQVAQAMIDANFGTYKSWLSSSYLRYRERNVLLCGSNNEKMQVLNELSFSTEDPGKYITKIDQEIYVANSQFLVLQEQLTSDINAFNHRLSQLQPDFSKYSKPEELEIILKKKQEESLLLHKECLIYQEISARRDQIKRDLQRLIENRKDISPLEMEISHLEEQLKLPEQYQRQQLKMKCNIPISDCPESLKALSLEQIRSIGKNDREQRQIRAQLDTLLQGDGSYNERMQSLKDKITTLESNLQQLEIRRRWCSLQEQEHCYNKQIELCGEDLQEDPNYIRDLYTKLQQLQHSRSLHKCPHCQGSIRIVSNQLVGSETQPASIDDIHQVEKKIKEHQHKQQQQERRRQLQQQLEQITKQKEQIQSLVQTGPIGPIGGEIAQSQDDLGQLKFKLQSATSLYQRLTNTTCWSDEELNQAISYHQDLNRKRELYNILGYDNDTQMSPIKDIAPPTPINPNVIHNKIRALQQEIALQHVQEKQIVDNQEQLEKIKLPDNNPIEQYQQCQADMTKLQKDINYNQMLQQLIKEQDNLNKRREEVLKIHSHLTALQTLRAKAVEVECQTLQNTVDTINATLNDVLDIIFDQPIRVTVQLFKTLKSKAIDGTQRIKPTVNVTIAYKGGEFTDINKLSGGEGDRISLAMTIALNRLSTCPFIMVDEAMSSIDGQLKEQCINALRSALGCTKAMYCINHEVTEGHYDKVLSIN